MKYIDATNNHDTFLKDTYVSYESCAIMKLWWKGGYLESSEESFTCLLNLVLSTLIYYTINSRIPCINIPGPWPPLGSASFHLCLYSPTYSSVFPFHPSPIPIYWSKRPIKDQLCFCCLWAFVISLLCPFLFSEEDFFN